MEFKKKRIARAVVQALNGNIIGGKKGSYYHDDIWTMKYLPRFKWANLTEKLAYDSAVRKKKLQRELTQVRKETNFYIEQVEKNKQISAVKRKREEKNLETQEPVSSSSEQKSAKQRKLANSNTSSKSISSNVISSVFTQ